MRKLMPAISLVIVTIVIVSVFVWTQMSRGPKDIQADRPELVTGRGELPTLGAAIRIMDDGDPVSVGHTASPEFVDWDNDGRKDLLVGSFRKGLVYLYLNRGTAEKPAFRGGSPLKAAGRVLSVGYS